MQNSVDQIRKVIMDDSHETIRQLILKLMKDLKYVGQQPSALLKETFQGIQAILKNPNQHPLTKIQSHKLIMYLILMGDPEVYEIFQASLFGIFKGNCQYNKNAHYEVKGEDFFKKSKFLADPALSNAQKHEFKKYGSDYIRFSLELVMNMAKWLPTDIQDNTTPSRYAKAYQELIKERIIFPPQAHCKFFISPNVQEIEESIKQLQKQIYSAIYSEKNTSSFGDANGESDSKNLTSSNGIGSLPWASNVPQKHQLPSQYIGMEEEKKKLQTEIETQRKYFEGELSRQKSKHQQNIYKYEKKINQLEDDVQKMKDRMTFMESRGNIKDESSKMSKVSSEKQEQIKSKRIDQLQKMNETLSAKLKILEEAGKDDISSKRQSLSNNSQQSEEISKLKKQNIALKTKLLTECEETREFENKKQMKKNMKKTPDTLQFIGYEDARSCFEPFYSNSSSEIKVRLRKAILREKQLLYKDKTIQIGCITKLQSINALRLIIVFTNISQKPLFNFFCEFVTREDLTVKIINTCRNYLEISGQTKSQVYITVNQIDFRCLLSSIRFTVETSEEKIALIMPISKLKLAQSLVYTPQATLLDSELKKPYFNMTNNSQGMSKVEKVFKGDRKILPFLHKFKDYYPNSLLQKDLTGHETYHMKMQFMGTKFYFQIDQIAGQVRIAIFYSQGKIAAAEKLLDDFVFVFSKNY